RRREGGLTFGPGVRCTAKIEVEAGSAAGTPDDRPRLFADTGDPDTWRAHQALLRGRNSDIDAPPVLLHVDTRETADSVRDQQCVPVADETASGREIAEHSCRALVVDMHQRPIVACLEPRLDDFGIDVLTPRHIDGLDAGADRGADHGEALAPLSIADDQRPLARRKDVDERSFHHAGAGASE